MIPDENTARLIGVHTLVYLRSHGANGEGGYEVRFNDGRTLRVLPDGVATTKRGHTVIQRGLDELAASVVDPYVYLVGALALAGLSWEEE